MRTVKSLSCHTCQTHLLAYIQGEVPADVRQQVSRHLQGCPVCYAHYREQETLTRDLALAVPLIGQGQKSDFARVWSSVQAEIVRARQPMTVSPARYGLALAALLLAFIAPLVLGNQGMILAMPPTQPVPVTLVSPIISSTPSTTAESAVAYLTDISQSTPEAPQHTAGPVAISTP